MQVLKQPTFICKSNYFLPKYVGIPTTTLDSIVKSVETLKLIAEDQGVAIREVIQEQKGVRFDVKMISDILPSNFHDITPSEDCETTKSQKYRELMKSLRLSEANNLMEEATDIAIETDRKNWFFNWAGVSDERESYKPLQKYLKDVWDINATIVADGEGLPDRLLYVSNIFTLRPRIRDRTAILNKTNQQPHFKFRVKGRTDLGVFRVGRAITCNELLWAVEVKPKTKFGNNSEINRALREGVLQLIGMNADNHYSSPAVIVTGLAKQHYVLYLELCEAPEVDLQFHLRIKQTKSLSLAVAFAQDLTKRGCITSRFASPPTPTESPKQLSPKKEVSEEDEDFDEDNVQLLDAEDVDVDSHEG